MTRLHLAVALLLGVVLPGYSWINGTGWLAWTMFAMSSTYRLSVRVSDDAGVTHVVNPTELARFARGDAATYLSGADHFRHAPVAPSLQRNLPGIALLACRTVENPREAWTRLETRATLDSPVVASEAKVFCDPRARGGE
jgi:hypothetical protein